MASHREIYKFLQSVGGTARPENSRAPEHAPPTAGVSSRARRGKRFIVQRKYSRDHMLSRFRSGGATCSSSRCRHNHLHISPCRPPSEAPTAGASVERPSNDHRN